MALNFQLGYDDERFESIVDQHFHCLICYNVLKDPVMCGRNQHYFCRGCITEHLRRNSHTCPTCADELTVETLTNVPRIVTDYLNGRKIRCDYEDRGCRELVQLQNLNRHVAKCGFSPVVCGNQGCGQTISKRDRTYHESELCQFRKLKCHNCEEVSTAMAGMETKVTDHDTKVHTKLNNMGTKMNSMDTKMDNMGTKINDVDTKMALNDTKLYNIDTKLNNMGTKMNNIDSKLKDMGTKINNVDTKINNMNTKMAHTDTKLAHTDTKLENMNTNMVNFQANVEARFEAVNNEIRGIRISLNEMKDGFDHLKEAVLEKIESKERKQEKITRDVSGASSGGSLNEMKDGFDHLKVAVLEKIESKERKQEEIRRDVSDAASGGNLNEMKDGFDHLKEAVLEKIESKEREQEEVIRDVSGAASGGRENRHIFVAGGRMAGTVEIFNYPQKLWSFLKPVPQYRESASSFVYDNHVTLAGGICDDRSLNNMIRMNIHPVPDRSIRWSDFAAKLPALMHSHSSVVYKDSLFLTGGCNDDKRNCSDGIHEVELKPPYTVKLLSRMPERRAYHSTVLCDDSILIVGGRKTGRYKDSLSSVLSYDIKNNECQQLPELPYPVSDMATVKCGENVMIIGGIDKDNKALNNVIVYNVKTGNSHMLPPMLHNRKGCMAVVIENTIVVLGGRGGGSNILKSVEGFSFDRYTWEELPDMKQPRYLATAVVI